LLLQKIFQQAQVTPQKLALAYRGQRISYGEFAYWIALARDFLARQGLRPGSIAALVRVPNVLDSWALRLALRSLGLTTVDLTAPEQLTGHRFKDLGCVITTIHDQPIEVPDAEYKLLRIPNPIFFGKQAEPVPGMPRIDVPVGGHILLTSGTTGSRKKVLRDETREAADLKRGSEIFEISQDSIVHALDFSPWTAAGYGLPVIAWMVGGGAICHEGANLHRSFDMDGITHAFFIPMKLEEVLAAPAGELRFSHNLRIFVGGAALTPALAAAAKARFTPHVYHTLGSTEGGALGLTRIENRDDLVSHIIVPGAGVQIVDEAERALPAGNVGIIRVRPIEGLNGYLDDEETSRRFFRDGYFYPGDLGEIRPDGRLVLHGRTSNTINLGGEKRPVEILEQRLQERLRLDGICLISIRGASQEDELHILIQSQRPVGRDEVTKALARAADLKTVPEAHLQYVDTIPRNEMGKIDRPAIRQKISATLPARPAA
jgi:non-ribosomal peptide synthetase component E (peptide arylation enzyme)